MTRRWPTRAWREGDGVGTAVYVGDRPGVVVEIATSWPVCVPRAMMVMFAEGPEPVNLIDLDVINETSWPVREAVRQLRASLDRGVQ